MAERHGMPHNDAAEAGAVRVRVERARRVTRQAAHAVIVAARAGGGVKGTRLHQDHLRVGRDYVENLHGSECGEVFIRDQMADVLGIAAGAEPSGVCSGRTFQRANYLCIWRKCRLELSSNAKCSGISVRT